MRNPLNVLLIEDSEDAALLIFDELQRCGFDVASQRVEDRGAFEAALQKGGWDVIISDFVVPGFGAFEALEIFRNRQLDIPFLVLSASAPEETVAEVMKAGAHDYVLKGNLTRLGPAIFRELKEAQVRAARKQLELQLRHSQKLEVVGQMAGGIAHDFNNVLTVILGYTDILLSEPDLDWSIRGHIEQIALSTQRASKLTRQLLAFSRKQPLQIRTVQLNEILVSMAGMLQRMLGEHIELELLLEPGLPVIQADASMLEQTVVNLGVNARDAMPKGGRLAIATRAETIAPEDPRWQDDSRPATAVCLTVKDNGCGMSPEVLGHVFEPFFTTKEVGKGTGLGLSTVYGIVQQHKGHISVKSEPGNGTEFQIILPVRNESIWTNAPIRIEPPHAAMGHETILLVEDEIALRTMARNVLQKHGYTVLEGSSGPAAIQVWEQHTGPIQLLLTDMVMPDGIGGRELAAILQSKQPNLKVLYTSGYSADFVQCPFELREGVNFIPKPYTATALCQIVRRCLDELAADAK